jgi:hypothetical protein
VREIPIGSGINGRPILHDDRRHIARYRQGHWWTWCGQQVPDEHRCPPYHEIMDRPGTYLTCWDCDLKYRQEQGEPILPGHPALT